MPVTLSPSLVDRLTAAFMSALVMAIMAVGLPVGLLLLTRGKGVPVLYAYLSMKSWGGAVVTAAAITGFALGSDKTVTLFGHLWLTARPRNAGLTALLWLGLVVIGFAGYELLPTGSAF